MRFFVDRGHEGLARPAPGPTGRAGTKLVSIGREDNGPIWVLLEGEDESTHGGVRERQRAETRRKLYHAALEVFCRDGVESCRIEDIAHKAEVSRAAFYFHFPTKDDVLFELLRESEHPIEEALARLPDDGPMDALFETFTTAMAEFWSQGERRKLIVELFAAQMRRLRAIAADPDGEPIRKVFARRFRLAAERGTLTKQIPPEMLADFYLLNSLTAMASWSAQSTVPLTDTLRGVSSLFLQGAVHAGEKS